MSDYDYGNGPADWCDSLETRVKMLETRLDGLQEAFNGFCNTFAAMAIIIGEDRLARAVEEHSSCD